MATRFFFQDVKISLCNRKPLKWFIDSIFIREKKGLASINYIFCTDQYLLDINKRFLKHDYFTDIITFNLADPNGKIEGEIYISVDRVRENSKKMQVSLREELHRVIFHGALHLCGYGDKGDKEKKKMTTAEDRCLRLYFK